MWTNIVFNNLQVLIVKLLGGPWSTLVWALSCSAYLVSGDNPSTVPFIIFDILFPKSLITILSYWIEYCVITPLGVSGGFHCKVTVVEVTEPTSNEHGLLGTENNINVTLPIQ